jgi:hypothetical protein
MSFREHYRDVLRKMVLARIWHDDVVTSVIGMVTGMIARAQARAEVAPGNPRLHAFSLMGPMVMAMLSGSIQPVPSRGSAKRPSSRFGSRCERLADKPLF